MQASYNLYPFPVVCQVLKINFYVTDKTSSSLSEETEMQIDALLLTDTQSNFHQQFFHRSLSSLQGFRVTGCPLKTSTVTGASSFSSADIFWIMVERGTFGCPHFYG